MKIPSKGFVIYIKRLRNEKRRTRSRTYYRTVGSYKCYYDGSLLSGPGLKGATAEPRGPGNNGLTGKNNALRIEEGEYPLGTHGFPGSKYSSSNYFKDSRPRPGIYVRDTSKRSAILIHKGVGFKASVGCINLTKSLTGPNDNVGSNNSFKHVDAVIKKMKELVPNYPSQLGRRIPNAKLIIDGEP